MLITVVLTIIAMFCAIYQLALLSQIKSLFMGIITFVLGNGSWEAIVPICTMLCSSPTKDKMLAVWPKNYSPWAKPLDVLIDLIRVCLMAMLDP